jgi:hypothetical protein
MPFDLMSEKRVKPNVAEKAEEFVSLREQVDSFYMPRSVKPNPASEMTTKQQKITLTKPKSPVSHLAKRVRATSPIKSTEERELEEIASVPAFHARPINKKILYGNAPIGINKPYVRPATEFAEFHLSSSSIMSCRPSKSVTLNNNNNVSKTFIIPTKLNRKILEGPDFVVMRSLVPPTEPVPFVLETEKRSQLNCKKDEAIKSKAAH